jgi:hypothetical protein
VRRVEPIWKSRLSRVLLARSSGPSELFTPQEMDVDDWNSPTTRLLTLLNVSAAKSLKRKCADQPSLHTPKRRVLDHISPKSPLSEVNVDTTVSAVDTISEQKDEGDVEVNEVADPSDAEGEWRYSGSSRRSAD